MLKNLRKLNLADNLIANIEKGCFLNLPKLEILELSNNFLNETSKFYNLEFLKRLTLNNNKFTKFTTDLIKGLNNLQELSLGDNLIEYILIDLSSLKQINLQNNRLKNLYFLNFNNLESLDLEYNYLTSFENFNLNSTNRLKSLILIKNNFKNISLHLKNFTYLTRLVLSDNFIENLEFSRMNYLKELTLYANRLTFIKSEIFLNLVNLEILDLRNNFIFSIESNAFPASVNGLMLSWNSLSTIPNLANVQNLKFLELDNQKTDIFFLKENNFDQFRAKNSFDNVLISLLGNSLKFSTRRLFCSGREYPVKNLVIKIDNINLINKCILKQIEHKNVSFVSLVEPDCSVKAFVEKYKIKIASKSNLMCCKKSTLINDNCVQYNCSIELSLLSRQTVWLMGALNLFSFSLGFEVCDLNSNFKCLDSEYFKIYCVITKIGNTSIVSNFLIELKISSVKFKNLSISTKGIEKDSIFKSSFKIVEFSEYRKILYHLKTETLMAFYKSDDFSSIFVRTSRYYLNKMSGFLISGCNFDKKQFLNVKNNTLCEKLNFSYLKNSCKHDFTIFNKDQFNSYIKNM